MQNKVTQTERQIFGEAYQFFADHYSPPPAPSEAAMKWWLDTAADVIALDQKWKGYPLMRSLLLAIYEDLDRKAKRAAKEAANAVQE